LDYIDGADTSKAIEQIILNGQLRSYGLNYASQKTKEIKRMDFHTLSKSEQQTPGRTPEESGIKAVTGTIQHDKLHNVAGYL
jgi:hypothetical protein